VTLTFELPQDNIKAVINVSNQKNQYVRWKYLPYFRGNPNTPNNVKVYYTINPESDYLVFPQQNGKASQNVKVTTVDDKGPLHDDEGKYVLISYKNGKQFFEPVVAISEDDSLYFHAKDGPNELRLPWSIYYDRLNDNITWKRVGAQPNDTSTFDAVTYAIVLTPGFPVTIAMQTPATNPDGSPIMPIERCGIDITGKEKPEHIILTNTPNEPYQFKIETIKTTNDIKTISFAGVLVVSYQLYDGGTTKTTFTRKFLIYEKVP